MEIEWLVWVIVGLAIVVGGLVWYLKVPPVPTLRKDFERCFKIAEPKPGEMLFDLGAGDGRVLQWAREMYRVRVAGWELNPVMWVIAKSRLGLGSRMYLASMWQAPVGEADVVFGFLMPVLLERVEREVWPKLKPGARLVLNMFPLPTVKPDRVDGKSYVYIRPGVY